MFLRFCDDEERKSRNIGSVGHEDVGDRNGGQERIHSVEVVRNVGIAGRQDADIKGQGVLESVGQDVR